MSARPGFTVSKIVGVDGGQSPNAYVGKVTVEIRVHYPARQLRAAALVLEDAIEEARRQLVERTQEHVDAGGLLDEPFAELADQFVCRCSNQERTLQGTLAAHYLEVHGRQL